MKNFIYTDWAFLTELNLKFQYQGCNYITNYQIPTLPIENYLKRYPRRCAIDISQLTRWKDLYINYLQIKELLQIHTLTISSSLEATLFFQSDLISSVTIELDSSILKERFCQAVKEYKYEIDMLSEKIKLFSILGLPLEDKQSIYLNELLTAGLPILDLLNEWQSLIDYNLYSTSKLLWLKGLVRVLNTWWLTHTKENFKLKELIISFGFEWSSPFSLWIEHGWSSQITTTMPQEDIIPLDLDYSTAKQLYHSLMKQYHPDLHKENSIKNTIITQEINLAWTRYKKYYETFNN